MHETIEINVWISFFDIVMIFLIAVGAYRGFAQGAIVQSISLFSLLVGLTICVNIAKMVHRSLDPISDIPDLIAMLIVAVLFVGAVYGTMKISNVVYRHISDVPKGFTNRVLGATFGGIKYFFIAAVYLVTMFKVDDHAKFLPDSAKASRFSNASKWMITSIFPYLKMDKKGKAILYERPDDANN